MACARLNASRLAFQSIWCRSRPLALMNSAGPGRGRAWRRSGARIVTGCGRHLPSPDGSGREPDRRIRGEAELGQVRARRPPPGIVGVAACMRARAQQHAHAHADNAERMPHAPARCTAQQPHGRREQEQDQHSSSSFADKAENSLRRLPWRVQSRRPEHRRRAAAGVVASREVYLGEAGCP